MVTNFASAALGSIRPDRAWLFDQNGVGQQILLDGPRTGTIGYGYDAQDNLTSVADQRGLVTSYAYSGFDELKTLTSPDTGVTQYTYDPAGNVKSMVDARGQSATYGYDAVNRLKSLLYTDETLDFTYDDVTIAPNSKGQLSRVTDGSGSTTYAYEPQGRVTLKTQVAGAVTSQVRYRYNAAGQMDLLTTPSGQAIGYGYANNQVTGVTVNGQNVLTGAAYFPFGEVKKWTWGNGLPYERVYDLDGRIQSVTLAGAVRTYGFDTASRITGLTDRQGPTTIAAAAIGYDNLDRLTSTTYSEGGDFNEVFAYDLIGNRTSQTISLVSSTTTGQVIKTYTYSPTSNRLTQLGPQAIGYDAAGNTQSDGALTYAYSGRNRLVEAKQGTSTLATYRHNAFGERVAKTLGGSTTTFVYDEDGRLLGEYGAAGGLIQETVWLEDTPVATLRPKAGGGIDVFYVWADHLDTPRAITTSTAANAVMWRWDSDAFGATAAQESGLAYNLRFPGQYFDVETGTHYNYFRDYNPQTGRYQQSDPAGLDYWMHLYAYAGSNPQSYFDHLGQKPGGKRRTEKHHAHPKFCHGEDVRQDLVPMCSKSHHNLHNDLNRFLRNVKNDQGNDMSPRRGNSGATIRNNFSPKQCRDALSNFYRGPGKGYRNAADAFFKTHK